MNQQQLRDRIELTGCTIGGSRGFQTCNDDYSIQFNFKVLINDNVISRCFMHSKNGKQLPGQSSALNNPLATVARKSVP